MKSLKEFSFDGAARLWAWVAGGLILMAGIFASAWWYIQQIETSRLQWERSEKTTSQAVAKLKDRLREGKADLLKTLDGRQWNNQHDWFSSLMSEIEKVSQDIDNENLRADLFAFHREAVLIGDEKNQVDHWSLRAGTAQVELEAKRKKVEEILEKIQTAVLKAEGERRVAGFDLVRKFEQATGEDAMSLAGKISRIPENAGAIISARSEMSRLYLVWERMMRVKNPKRLDELKDEQFEVTLKRLENDLIMEAQETSDETAISLNSLKEEMFGKGYVLDPKRQRIFPTQDGYYLLLKKQLKLEEEAEALRIRVAEKFASLERKITQIGERFQAASERLAGKTDNVLADGRKLVFLSSIFGLCAFLLLSGKVIRGIGRQVTELEQMRSHLQGSLEITRLMKKIAIACNEAKSVRDAIRFVLRLIWEEKGWAVAHARFSNIKNRDDKKLQDLWKIRESIRFETFARDLEKTRENQAVSVIHHVYSTKEYLWISNLDGHSDLPELELMKQSSIQTVVAFPIIQDSEVVGVLEFFHEEKIDKHDALVFLLKHTGVQLGRVFEREAMTQEWREKAARKAGSQSPTEKQNARDTEFIGTLEGMMNDMTRSAGLLREKLDAFPLEALRQGIKLIRGSKQNLSAFFHKDDKGQTLPEQFEKIWEDLGKEKEGALMETSHLYRGLNDMREILHKHRDPANHGLEGNVEVEIPALLDEILTEERPALESSGIQVVRKFAEMPPVPVDREKLRRVLVNLISNARQALILSDKDVKQLTVRANHAFNEDVIVEVEDNGPGIKRENLTRVFTQSSGKHKERGEGKLRDCFTRAKDLGASLTARSDGLGKGSTFALRLKRVAGLSSTSIISPL